MPAPAPNLPPVLLPRKEVLRRIALGNTSLWIMCKSGHFPQPVILNPHARFPKLAWREAEVSQWINSREKGIGAGPPGTAYERRTALAQARLTAGLTAAQPNQNPSLDARRDRAEHPNSSQAIDASLQAIVTKPVPARPVLLRRRPVRAK